MAVSGQDTKVENGGGGPPDALEDAARGKDVGEEGERSVIDWLVGRTHRPGGFVDVEFETPEGRKKLRAFVKAVDDRRMDEIDAENRAGDGPFAKLDTAGFNAALVAEGVEKFVDPRTEKEVVLDSREFIGAAPNLATAVEGRFKYQPGLLAALAERIRELGGYDPERVGTTQRLAQTAVGNSSGAGD